MKEYPVKLEIELARGLCTADCPMCSINETKYNKKLMKNDDFFKIIDSFGDNLEKIEHVNLVGLGEVLLDKKLCEKIIYLKKKKIKHVSFPTNASLLNEKLAEKILLAGLDEIIIGVDSLKKETFEKIRKGLEFEEVLRNTLNYIKVRDRLNVNSKIMIRIITSDLNDFEWEPFKNFWAPKLNFKKGDMVLHFPEHNWATHDYENKLKSASTKQKPKCSYVYDRLCLDAHGNVKLCCIDINANFYNLGNVLEQNPIELFNSKIFKSIRDTMDQNKIDTLKHCKVCNVPYQRAQRGYFKDKEILVSL